MVLTPWGAETPHTAGARGQACGLSERHPTNPTRAKERPSLWLARRLSHAWLQASWVTSRCHWGSLWCVCSAKHRHAAHRNGKPELNAKFPGTCVWDPGKRLCAGRKEGWAGGIRNRKLGSVSGGVPSAHSCQLGLEPFVITILQYQLGLAVFSYPLANEDFTVCFRNTSLAHQVADSNAQRTVVIQVWNHSSQRKDNIRERPVAFKEQK